MWTSWALALLAAVPLASTQTWPGFEPRIPEPLTIRYGTRNITRGELIEDLSVVQNPFSIPRNLTNPSTPTSGRWIFIMLDSDAPINSSRTQYLHWIAEVGANDTFNTTPDPEDWVMPDNEGDVRYTRPAPQAGDSPHRYSVLMYERPDRWSTYRNMTSRDWDAYRVGFDIVAFLNETGSGGLTRPLAATYFRAAQALPSGELMPSFPPPAYEMGPKVDGPEGWWSESSAVAPKAGYCVILIAVGAAMFLM